MVVMVLEYAVLHLARVDVWVIAPDFVFVLIELVILIRDSLIFLMRINTSWAIPVGFVHAFFVVILQHEPGPFCYEVMPQ